MGFMRVLIAEDDAVTLQLLTAGFRRAGIAITTAVDAMQAVMLAMKDPPDAVVLDIHMPGGTGLMVLKRLKASARTSNIPVIAITSTAGAEQRAEALKLGAVECLEKPLDVNALIGRLKELTGGS
jgi:DNA-binding response OmpR family regulator